MNLIQRTKLIYFLSEFNFVKQQINYFSTKNLETEIKDDICFIKFNKPEKRNCLNFKSIRYLKEQLNELNNDDKIKKIIFYGKDGNFCSGLDLNELNKDNENELIDLYSNQNWFKSNKLLISYVQGYAVGLGFELAINSDLLIIDHTAKLGFLNRRFGLPSLLPLDKLKNLIGRSNTLNILDNAILIDSREAFNIGLTKYVLNKSELNLNESNDNLDNKIKLTSNQIIKSLNLFEIDFNELDKLKLSNFKINKKFNKFNDLPEEWRNLNFNSTNYNLNKNRHGRYDLSFWNQIQKLQNSKLN